MLKQKIGETTALWKIEAVGRTMDGRRARWRPVTVMYVHIRTVQKSQPIFRLAFAMGKIRGTSRMRSHIFVPGGTTKFFSKSFVFKNNDAKEGLRKDNPSSGPSFATSLNLSS